MLVLIKNYKELHYFLQNIVETMNCIEVSSNFKFEMSIFLFSDDFNT
jgi:hypothetical protein